MTQNTEDHETYVLRGYMASAVAAVVGGMIAVQEGLSRRGSFRARRLRRWSCHKVIRLRTMALRTTGGNDQRRTFRNNQRHFHIVSYSDPVFARPLNISVGNLAECSS